jgi:hypothetical protein
MVSGCLCFRVIADSHPQRENVYKNFTLTPRASRQVFLWAFVTPVLIAGLALATDVSSVFMGCAGASVRTRLSSGRGRRVPCARYIYPAVTVTSVRTHCVQTSRRRGSFHLGDLTAAPRTTLAGQSNASLYLTLHRTNKTGPARRRDHPCPGNRQW